MGYKGYDKGFEGFEVKWFRGNEKTQQYITDKILQTRFGKTPFLNYETGRRILRHEYGDVIDLFIGQQSQLHPTTRGCCIFCIVEMCFVSLCYLFVVVVTTVCVVYMFMSVHSHTKASHGHVVSSSVGVPHVAHAKAKEAWSRTKDPQIVSALIPPTLEVEYRILKYMASEIRTGRGDDWYRYIVCSIFSVTLLYR